MNFDIIGDIHGEFGKLESLLRLLGYRESNGAYRHPDRTAVFVGDLIDRGPQQLATVGLVRRMVDAGSALCILGNHEFNAIAWATPVPSKPTKYLRDHQKTKNGVKTNRKQHEAFLKEVEGKPIHGELIQWFKTLPLWLDLGGVRIVHACWNEVYMEQLQTLEPRLGPARTLTEELIVESSRKGRLAYKAVEALCKGLEVDLPGGLLLRDAEGQERKETRIKWWADGSSTFRQAALAAGRASIEKIPDLPMPPDPRVEAYNGPPVFVGHYWLEFNGATPQLLAPNIACVDYSAAKDGPLVAYQWDGESELSVKKFRWFPGKLD